MSTQKASTMDAGVLQRGTTVRRRRTDDANYSCCPRTEPSIHVCPSTPRVAPPGCALFEFKERERHINQWGTVTLNWTLEGERGRNRRRGRRKVSVRSVPQRSLRPNAHVKQDAESTAPVDLGKLYVTTGMRSCLSSPWSVTRTDTGRTFIACPARWALHVC